MECFLWLSVTENEDSPMQEKTIEGAEVTHYTLMRLDHNSHYRFYLRGRTAAGKGEALQRDGATTLEGGTKTTATRKTLVLCHFLGFKG